MAALVAAGGTLVAALAVPYTGWWRDAHWRRQTLDQLAREPASRASDPLYLYWLGVRLNERGRFDDAAPVLERAVGLSPDEGRLRDAWTQALLGTGRVTLAFGQLREFAAHHPQSADAHWLLGKFYVTQQADRPANEALERAVAVDPTRADAWSLLAQTRLRLGQSGRAAEALETALRLRPDSAIDQLQKASLLALREPEKARAAFERAVVLDPTLPMARRELAGFLLRSGDARAALPHAEAATRLDPEDARAHLALGRARAASGDPAGARTALERSAALAPFDPLPTRELQRVCRTLGDTAAAGIWDTRTRERQALTEARRQVDMRLDADPRDPALHRTKAQLLARIGDTNGCVQELARAIGAPQDSGRVLTASARALLSAGRAAEALPLVRQVLLRSDFSPDAYETAGDICVALGRLREAAVHYAQLQDWRPARRPEYARRIATKAALLAHDPAPVERLTRQAEAAPDPQRAEAFARQALALAPENTRALRRIVGVRFALRDAAGVRETADRLLAISPEDGSTRALRALVALQSADGEAAWAALDDELGQASHDPSAAATVAYTRGLLALRRGQGEEAVRQLRRSARLDPSSVSVWERIAEAERLAGNETAARAAQAEAQRRRNKRSQ